MTSSPLPVLVVEDNKMNQTLLMHQLRRIGITDVELCENGMEALEWLSGNRCAVVLADCQMPRMDGYAMTRAIRQRELESGGRLPVIAISASVLAHDQERCIQAGMDGFLHKPVSLASLRKEMERWLVLETNYG